MRMRVRTVARVAGAVLVGSVVAGAVAVELGGCKQVIGWEAATEWDGGSDPTPCSPGTTQACYTGMLGTEDAGTCHGGTQVCATDGISWGTCTGEVKPPPRTCANMPGSSCDGIDCVLLAMGLSGGYVTTLAASPDGSVIVTGKAVAAMQLGTVTLPAGGFIAKIKADGTAPWIVPFAVSALAVDASGNVFAAGLADAPFPIGTTTVPMSQFVLKLNADGKVLWAKSIAGSSTMYTGSSYNGGPMSIAVSPDGDLVLAGVFSDTSIDVGDGPIPPFNSNSTAYVTKLSGADGSGTKSSSEGQRWTLTGPAFKRGYSYIGPFVGVASSGDVSVVGNFGAQSLGKSTFPGPGNVGLLRMSSTSGSIGGVRSYGDGSGEVVLSARVEADGTTLFTGSFMGTINLGATSAQPPLVAKSTQDGGIPHLSQIGGDGFVIAVSAANFSIRLALGFNTAGHGLGAQLDSAGNVVLTGTFMDTADIGGTKFEANQGTSVLLAKFTPGGSLLWGRAFPHPYEEWVPLSLAVTPDQSSWLGGFAAAWPLDFGSGPVNSAASPRAGFVAHFAP